jgi:predicted lipid-binding transport protein (Tim44 family)
MRKIVVALAVAGLLASGATSGAAAGTCADQLKTFSEQWNKSSPGHKTADARKYYEAAQSAMKAKNERDCKKLLDQAAAAMK